MNITKPFQIVKLSAPNDKNGNPRRLFAVLQEGLIRALLDEGFSGEDCMPKELQGYWRGTTFTISAKEYNDWKKTIHFSRKQTDD